MLLNLDPGFWNVVPTLLWVAFALIFLQVFRRDLKQLVKSLVRRVTMGASLKIASLEIGATYVTPNTGVGRAEGKPFAVRDDVDRRRCREREAFIASTHKLFLVHRLVPSTRSGQLYDIQVYLVPEDEATLAGVKQVEYYFGPYWQDKIFTCMNRASGFTISTSAYGPIICTAEIVFNDGHTAVAHRYVDFEMGAIGTYQDDGKDG